MGREAAHDCCHIRSSLAALFHKLQEELAMARIKSTIFLRICVAMQAGFGLSAPVCHADTVLRFKSTTESISERRVDHDEYYQIWLGSNVARWDFSKTTSYIVDAGEQRMFILNHVKKTFHELKMPVVFLCVSGIKLTGSTSPS